MDVLVVNVDRKLITRSRLHAVGAGAAFALLVGLSAPAAALTASTSTADTPAADTPPAAEAESQTVAAAAAQAVTEAVTPAEPAPLAAPASAAVPGLIAPAPSATQLHPLAPVGTQQQFTPTVEQMSNAKAIVQAGQEMGLPPRAWIIAVATSLQETNLKNLGHLGERNDHDSQGLFQQRPSSGWGTVAQITDPNYAATAFYKGLVEVPGWESMPLTAAAQKVQVSAFPDHYAKHEAQAGDMIAALYGAGPHAGVAASLK